MRESRHTPTTSAHYGKHIGLLFTQRLGEVRCAVGQTEVNRLAFEGKNTAIACHGSLHSSYFFHCGNRFVR